MRVPVPDVVPAAEELGAVHLVGVGGAGLSAIARVMAQRGVVVSGSDAQDGPVLAALAREGVRCFVGHDAAHVAGVDTVVVSTAVREDNPEVVAATAAGLRLWPRSAGVQSLLVGRDVVAVAGTHGKTTTTSMLTMALRACGRDPSFAIGAEVPALGTNAHAGDDPVFVAEADESDGAFLVYEPRVAVVTNVDADHLDVWGTVEAYEAAFATFVGRVRAGGSVVLCGYDPGALALREVALRRGLRAVVVGTGPDADLRLDEVDVDADGTRFVLRDRAGGEVARVALQVAGHHYALDAALALAAGVEAGSPADALAAGLGTYAGARRRMERVGERAGVRVYDSYAHHPTEIAGDLRAARAIAGPGRLLVAYQPHLVSRTRLLGAASGAALSAADEVVVTGIYLAREDPDPAVTSALVADAVALPAGAVHRVATVAEVAEVLVDRARPGDLVLTLGAGDITTAAPEVVALLGERA